MSRIISRLTAVALAVPAALTATANGAAVDVSRFTGLAKAFLNSTAMGGTASPTSTTKLQHSDDGSTGWADVPTAAFSPVTTTASHQELLINTDRLKKFVRAVDTISGTTPTVTRGVTLVGTLAY